MHLLYLLDNVGHVEEVKERFKDTVGTATKHQAHATQTPKTVSLIKLTTALYMQGVCICPL